MIDDAAVRTDEEVDILFFEIGPHLYGVDASQVQRIERALPGDLTRPELGELHQGRRALVFDTPEGEAHLKVDAVQGVRPINIADLRRLPAAVTASPFAIGVVLEEAHPVLLIDLVETAKTQGRH
ncbi:Frizzy aggregation protein FrzB [Stigmatella aurantiaca]|nr:Frizzy aggregation protein FrzB [Stigmatella aurantiaca]ADO72369.1 Frizzy aggregation protein FrzB [Stigmatella aurantiaca DW4/3-1]